VRFRETSVHLIAKALVLSAWWAGQRRRLCLAQAARSSGHGAGPQAEVLHLRDEVAHLSAENVLLKERLRATKSRRPYP